MPELEGALHICSFCMKDEEDEKVDYIVCDNIGNNICNLCVEILIKIDNDYKESKCPAVKSK